MESAAATLSEIIEDMRGSRSSQRQGRVIGHDGLKTIEALVLFLVIAALTRGLWLASMMPAANLRLRRICDCGESATAPTNPRPDT